MKPDHYEVVAYRDRWAIRNVTRDDFSCHMSGSVRTWNTAAAAQREMRKVIDGYTAAPRAEPRREE